MRKNDDKSDGGPAFPATGYGPRGLSVRDWFAGQALTGIMASVASYPNWTRTQLSESAWIQAESMLQERDKETT